MTSPSKPYRPRGLSEPQLVNYYNTHRVITESGCWEISWGLWAKERPKIQLQGHRENLARLYLRVYSGPGPEGSYVLHTCDNELCVNPDHLYYGTQRENLTDARDRGRLLIGVDNSQGKYTSEQIQEMRLLRTSGYTLKQISEITGCSVGWLSRVTRGLGRTSA